ncbi:MAG: hypothetical protein IJK58_06700 [Clostridia bacterium]|nr:hypothetical protein [Clostridia bacterium]
MAERIKKTFRGSVRGFKKKDVNGYILELSRKYTEVENEYRERIAELEERNEKLSAQLKEAQARAEEAEARADAATEGKAAPKDAEKAAEALSEIKKMRSQLKKRVREFEDKYHDVLPAPKKAESKPAAAAEVKSAPRPEKPAVPIGDFDSYLKEFRSSTSALFEEFDKKYGTKISGGSGK